MTTPETRSSSESAVDAIAAIEPDATAAAVFAPSSSTLSANDA
jgi:hypothetical protein